jgi:hypothetical protein
VTNQCKLLAYNSWWQEGEMAFRLQNNMAMLLLTTFLVKPMFKINKPLLISKQTMVVTWKKISWLVNEYFAMSLNNFHVANEYTKNIL